MSEAAPGIAAPSAGSGTQIAGSQGTQDPTKGSTPATGNTTPEPEFEYEVEETGPDGKAAKKITKLKMSEAKARLAGMTASEARVAAEQARQNRYYHEQIKPLEEQVEAAKRDPSKLFDFAKRLGVDFDKAALIYAQRQIELTKMTPEQRELHATREELATLKANQETQKQQFERQQEQAQLRATTDNVANQIMSAAKDAGLPNDPGVLMLMTGFMRSQAQKGLTPDAKAAAQYAGMRIDNSLAAKMDTMTYEQLEKNYPKLLTLVREGDIKKVRGATPEGSSEARPARKQSQGSQRIYTPAEYQLRLERGE